MRVLVSPVVVEGKICRIVAPIPMLIEVQEWTGEYWLPSNVPLITVSSAPAASIALLRLSGVPPSDCLSREKRSCAPVTEAMLIEMAVETEIPIVSGEEVEESERLRVTAIREKYPGSKRFRRMASSNPPPVQAVSPDPECESVDDTRP